MTVFTSEKPLVWGELDVPMLALARDWDGAELRPAAGWCLAEDRERLWFIAHHAGPAEAHPEARPGEFQAGLWKHDCAELFIAHPPSGRYMEFNLSPNGAWWCCEFTAPRVRAENGEGPMPDVAAFADSGAAGGWLAALALPKDLLAARVGYGEGTRANVAMILGSPDQRFLSVADLGGGAADFHRPGEFPVLESCPLAKAGAIG